LKLYSKPLAPNPLRVTMLAHKKGLTLDIHNLGADDTRNPEYREINPIGQVPVLELDDGTHITESLTICQYLDAISGPPYLCGDGLEQRTRIAMWERRAEFQLLIPAVEYGHHRHPMFAARITQYPDWAGSIADAPRAFLTLMESRLAETRFLAGPDFSIADITAYYGCRFATVYGLYPTAAPVIADWLDRVDAA
jgi:glutathione S-transferase